VLRLTAPEARGAPGVARAASSPLAPSPTYARHIPERTLLYALVQAHYPDFLARCEAEGRSLPEYVRAEFEEFLRCGVLDHGFLRVVCEMAVNGEDLRSHRSEIRREDARSTPKPALARPPPTRRTARKGRLNFLYSSYTRAEQIRLRLSEANDRELYQRLLDAFVDAIERSGAEPPEDEEERMQQLDLVLVRRPTLLREAYKRMRVGQVVDVDVPLAGEITSSVRLESASRALYGVFPADLNGDERLLANLLDADPMVRWWHRNPPRCGVGLYRWDEGEGFYPDFVVCVEGRAGAGIALVEVKGEHLWGKDSEVDKSHARHPDYGLVRMVGRSRGERDFVYLHAIDRKLSNVGAFNVASLRLLG
jgi:hypothetical protein